MARVPWAEWRPLGPIAAQPPINPTVLIFHTMEGYLRGTDVTFRKGGYVGVESTFGVGGPADGSLDGALWQWQDTHRSADAQFEGNAYADSVETSDGTFPSHPWSSKQIQTLVRLTADWCRLTGNPCKLVARTSKRGLGYHAQFKPWNHDGKSCPGAVRVGQLRTIVIPKARAALANDSHTPHPIAPSQPDGLIAEDSIAGPETIAALQRELGLSEDGIFGPETRVSLQLHLGTRPDSAVGSVTIRALESRVGLDERGVWDHVTTLALQKSLNAGSF